MNRLIGALVVCALVGSVRSDSDAIEYCYHNSSCSYERWSTLFPEFCNGTRQSPVDIDPNTATEDSSLNDFTFENFNSLSALSKIENTGKTVKVSLTSGVKVSGGGLPDSYDGLQFHLHWGNGSSVPGSEHTVGGRRYPMEMHIVNVKSSYNLNTSLAVQDSTGLAALGFFIEVREGNATESPSSWNTLASYLEKIPNEGDSVSMSTGLSLDSLLIGVDRSMYYRYLGSLTTPTCNEAVVWTVFKEPIRVSKDVIDLFSTSVRIGDNTSALSTNTFRGTQPSQPVRTTSSTGGTSATGGTSPTVYSLMVISLFICRLFGQ